MVSPKYLIYDNLVVGAGIGHTLNEYMKIYSWAVRHKYAPILPLAQLGHGLGTAPGLFEATLGLPNNDSFRTLLINDVKDKDLWIKRDTSPSEDPLYYPKHKLKVPLEVLQKFLDYYEGKTPLFSVEPKEKAQVFISIRRGDVSACKDQGAKNRMIATSFFRNALQWACDYFNLRHPHVTIISDGGIGKNKGHYVNQNGDIENLHDHFSEYLQSLTISIGSSCAWTTCRQFQAAVESDIFIGSPSGFSKSVALYRPTKPTLLPPKYNA